MFRMPSLVRGRRGYEEGEELRERWEDVMGRRGISEVHTSPPPHHHSTHSSHHPSSPSPTTHSPHRNDVIRKDGEVHLYGSHVERLVSHQLKVGSRVTKSVEGFK